jgi:hypothetical protein
VFLPLYTTALAAWPAGETIDPAATADITKEGFDAIAGLIPSFLPPSVDIPDTSDGYEGVLDQCYLGGYEYSLTNGWVNIEVTGASITPGNGVLDVTADLLVSVNDSSDPFVLYTMLECLEDTCYGNVDPFAATISTTMALDVVDDGTGGKALDATVGEIVLDYELAGEDIHLEDCTVGDVEEILNYVGLSLYDLILSLVGGQLDSAVADFGPQLEETIEDAFASATIEQDLDLNGVAAHVKFQPSDVQITPDAARIVMAGSMSADQAECVEAYDPGTSLQTDSEAPDAGDYPAEVGGDVQIALHLGDDFANQALYALWRGGLLCYTLGPELGISIDTTVINSISDQAFAEIFPEGETVAIVTSPGAPPTVDYTGSHDLDVAITDLGVDFYAELDGRQARFLGLAINGGAGVDLALDGSTGELGIELDIGADSLTPSVAYNELAASANDAILAGFNGLFSTLLGSLLGGLTDGLAFALPSFSGIGLEELAIAPNGAASDWLGLYAWIGPVEYGSGSSCGGCGGDTGTTTDTGSSSCGSTGCAAGPMGPAWLAGILSLVALRRRR